MSHKKRITKPNKSIEVAIEQLHFPLINNICGKVYLNQGSSSHSSKKHIAKQYHGLEAKDIEIIPKALKNPDYVCKDPKHKEKKNYYKKRPKTKKIQFIKIVTKIINPKTEKIVTIFTTNKIKN